MEKTFLLLVTAIAIAEPALAMADEKFSADSPGEKKQDNTAIPKVEINGAVDYDPVVTIQPAEPLSNRTKF